MNAFLEAKKSVVPWYIWLAALAVTSAMVGVQWDISWHRSIGRDSFLTPAHIAIYLCGVLAGICCGYLILATTFGHSRLREASITVWGFRGPLGAFVAAWGGFVMLTSAPFDDWWHGAYGLDVKILSPPHIVLAIGMVTVEVGALLLAAGQKNRTVEARRGSLDTIFIYIGAMVMVALLTVGMDYIQVSMQHSALFYRVVCMIVPGILALVSAGSGKRWAATFATAVYSVFMLGFLWILPFFPAEPKLGPVFHQVTHFVPPSFPLLLVIPAVLLDLFWWHTRKWNALARATVSGLIFLLGLCAAQWPFANFLQSPAARNPVFGSAYFDYLTRPASLMFRHMFYTIEKTPSEFWSRMGMAAVWAIATTRIGLACGAWIRDIRR